MSLLARIGVVVRRTAPFPRSLAPATPTTGATNELALLSLQLCREAGTRYVRVLAARGACPACQSLAGRQFSLAQAPQLPPVKCVCANCCCCCYTPVV